ncbi:isocitrate lyase/phosphoenolpyruvate mutase family protein [Streptomyces sp. NPDC056347]|uniref:isocitrate lyase/PEP mutase family protein n=1 Tax=Streptomyces sp. NPDC056347 TaxID=3345790 RepID=UPI0035DB6317
MTAAVLRALHHDRTPGDPLVLPGPWDAASARVFAEAGFPALATPSAGVAASLGYADGEVPAAEMFAAVARIVRAVPADVPVTADVEAGYGLPPKELVERLLESGAVGCNLEDSADGVLVEAERQADRLAAVREAAGGALFVNARVDTYVHGAHGGPSPAPGAEAETETVHRALLYVAAGADCVYPIMAPAEVLPRLAAAVPGPLNALARPDGPGPRRLGELGATRITFGPGFQRRAMAAVRGFADELLA